ncbi:hypothetical protein B0H10DRAFT_1665615, partial [Mycena sp. CBHHK59/15]
MDMHALKIKAAAHLLNDGKTLAVGHTEKPALMYDNPKAYPQMFPWLFPYGFGGFGNGLISGRIGEGTHMRNLLLYHDKRFQTDVYFPIVAFNHLQMKKTSSQSFLLADRANFPIIADRLLGLNLPVLNDLTDRMINGEMVKPITTAEKECFDVLGNLDSIAGKVKGSLTSKKYLRSEIWSLTGFMGAPTWFIMLSPADLSHPLCLYYTGSKINFSPTILCHDDRYLLISKNPVAAARFFNYVVRAFIKHVLRVETDHNGVYDKIGAYYGTVEQ